MSDQSSIIGLGLLAGLMLLFSKGRNKRKNPDEDPAYFLKRKDGGNWKLIEQVIGDVADGKEQLSQDYVDEANLSYYNDEYIKELEEDGVDVDWYEAEGYYDDNQELMLLQAEYENGINEYSYDIYSWAVAKESELDKFGLENTGNKAREKLIKGIKKLGLSVEIEESRMSRSIYLHVSQKKKGEVINEWKIRQSNHEARPTYEMMHGAADYEVGDYLTGGTVAGALKFLKNEMD